MLENHQVLPVPAKHYDGTCPTCGTEFETDLPRQADEDGTPIHHHRTHECANCAADLCDECERNGAAFRCEWCRQPFCATHKRELDGEDYCDGCYVVALKAAYAEAKQEIAAGNAALKIYESACKRIEEVKATDAPESVQLRDAEWAWALGKARGIAISAPMEARAAAIMAAA